MRYLLFLLFFYTVPLVAVNQQQPTAAASLDHEIAALNHLIETTKKNFQNQNKLLEQLKKYQEIQDQYLKDTNDNEVLFQLVKEGYALSEGIKTNQLTDLFSTEFMSELNLISQVAVKRGIPKP